MQNELADILDLEMLDINLFRNRHHRENFKGTLFGGQVLAQALLACYLTQDAGNPLLPHSLHAYFLRAGKSDDPVIYDVEKVRDGRSIASRRVVARQYGRSIFNMASSFHVRESGYSHQSDFPKVPTPEQLIAARQTVNRDNHIPAPDGDTNADGPLDILAIDNELFECTTPREAEALFWIKSSARLSDDPIHHFCALAFASDLGLLATTLLPHGVSIFSETIYAASIDHAMWFHCTDFRADEWLLCRTTSPWAGGGRGFATGQVFTRDGTLVLTTTQEGLIRPVQ